MFIYHNNFEYILLIFQLDKNII